MGATDLKKSCIKSREEISPLDQWDVAALYSSWEVWEQELQKQHSWPAIATLRMKWHESASSLKNLLDLVMQIDRKLSTLCTYAHMRHDEDSADETAKNAYMRASTLYNAFAKEIAWIEPEILRLSDPFLQSLLQAPELKEYHFYLEKIVRAKPHTLDTKGEELLALGQEALGAAEKIFGAFHDADLTFPSAEDSEGKQRELTLGTYSLYAQDPDPKLRKSAFLRLHRRFAEFENTLADMLHSQVQRHLFLSRARSFSSCLEASLFPHNIDSSVYHSLIEAVRKQIHTLHRYVALRKRVLGVAELHTYDMQVPLVTSPKETISYELAVQMILDSLQVMGPEYVDVLRRGFTEQRWVDRYENKRKRSGAYSGGCYDSRPYILMNYHGRLRDVMTLAHEAGHSMHSFYSRKEQSYVYSQYGIFVAEVASTFHEELLLRHLLSQAESEERRILLINQKVDDIRATLIRQTLFAEFEWQLHKWGEKGVPLTAALLKKEYGRLCQEYYGPEMTIDPETEIEWARIPHFYYNFYVYQYATGISAAHALADQVLGGERNARERYISFLSAGCSQYPLDLLAQAGVNMRTPALVESAMGYFGELVGELDRSLK